MPKASDAQMAILAGYDIILPGSHNRWGVLWQPNRWSKQHASAIISFVREGNGGRGTETTPDERAALYQNAREKYEGMIVRRKGDPDKKRYLVLVVVPETRKHLLWVANQRGVDPSQISPFCCSIVAEEEPPDHDGHIFGSANLDKYCVVGEATAVVRSPRQICSDSAAFYLQTGQMLFITLRAFTEQKGFGDGDILPSPEDVAVEQERLFRQIGAEAVYSPLSAVEVAEVYQRSHYVRQKGDVFIVVARTKVVSVA